MSVIQVGENTIRRIVTEALQHGTRPNLAHSLADGGEPVAQFDSAGHVGQVLVNANARAFCEVYGDRHEAAAVFYVHRETPGP